MIEIRRMDSSSESILSVKGLLNRNTWEIFEGMVNQLTFGPHSQVIIDLQEVRRIDSFGTRAIQRAFQVLQESGRTLLMMPCAFAALEMRPA